jgi:hypothetical protein
MVQDTDKNNPKKRKLKLKIRTKSLLGAASLTDFIRHLFLENPMYSIGLGKQNL